MKTNKIFLSLLCCSTMAMVATSCGEPKEEIIPGEKIHDTLTKDSVININILSVNTIQICADKSGQTIKFDATSDWTWTLDSKADWMTATTLSGTKGEGKLDFKVTENTAVKERRATTILKMDGHDNKITIVQQGSAPYVEIYNGEIILGKEMTEAYINNIVSNVELKVKSFPKWIESVDLEYLDDYEGAHQAFVILKPWSFDDGERTGTIRFENPQDPSVGKDYTIKCGAFTDNYFLDSNGLSGKPGQVDTIQGLNSVAAVAITRDFFVYANPTKADFEAVVLTANDSRYEYQGDNIENHWATTAILNTRTAYDKKTVRITCTPHTYANPGTPATKSGAVYVMPKDEVEAFITKVKAAGSITDAPDFTFVQGRYDYFMNLTPSPSPKFEWSIASSGVYTVKIRENLTLDTRLEAFGGFENDELRGITLTTSEPVISNGWATYKITIAYDGSTEGIDKEAYFMMHINAKDAEGTVMPADYDGSMITLYIPVP